MPKRQPFTVTWTEYGERERGEYTMGTGIRLCRKGKQGKWAKSLAFLLCLVLLAGSLAGCGRQGQGAADGQEGMDSSAEGSPAAKKGSVDMPQQTGSEENTALGRYVEKVTDLSELLVEPSKMVSLSDGRLAILDKYKGIFMSEDDGVTWEEKSPEWYREMLDEEAYILDIAMAPDGSTGVVYDTTEADANKKEAEDESDDKEEETEEEEFSLHPEVMLVKADGSQVMVKVPMTPEGMYPDDIWAAPDGRFFISVLGETNLYEISKEGECKLYLKMEDRPQRLQITEDGLLIADGYWEDGLVLYDMNKGQYLEDEVLADFMNENYRDRSFNGNSWGDLGFCYGREEQVVYLAGKKGLHRHVIGGGAIEQVVDGTLSSLSNPSRKVVSLLELENHEFLILFIQGKLIRYVYDPDMPTVPNENLKLYSLYENDTLRQAINLYQTANPQVYVEYEVGIGQDSSVTRQDALKKLNTQIMAGEGPDFLVLDDMPVDSYMEKGMLLDLTDFAAGLSGEEALFGGVVDAMRKDGKLYMIPAEVQAVVALGAEKYVSQMKDIRGVADTMEQLRTDYPGKDLIFRCTEKAVMGTFSTISIPFWKKQDGTLDRGAIGDFLEQSKRIYDAEMDGLDEKYIEHYNRLDNIFLSERGYIREDNPELLRYVDEMSYVGGEFQIAFGPVSYAYDYMSMLSVPRIKAFADNVLMPMGSGKGSVFLPKTLAGISAVSQNQEEAMAFMKVLLGKENQSSLFSGTAVNRAAFEESLIPNPEFVTENGQFGSRSMSDGNGLEVSLDIYAPTREQIDELLDWMETLKVPCISDELLENAVYQEGVKYMRGEKSLEEALDGIEEQVSIYMAE